MAKAKVFTLTVRRDRGTQFTMVGTVAELVMGCAYTLDCGRSYQHEKGNKKINCNPTTINGLVSNLNNAVNNRAANGYAGVHYSAELATAAEIEREYSTAQL
jgi:hypothetical protein